MKKGKSNQGQNFKIKKKKRLKLIFMISLVSIYE